MLIDASHPEETRVVVLDGNRVEEFDFEAASKRPLKGNIYLAKVTRVEPSLQAAFVDTAAIAKISGVLGIHPDYTRSRSPPHGALAAKRTSMDEEEDGFDSLDWNGPAQKSVLVATTAWER